MKKIVKKSMGKKTSFSQVGFLFLFRPLRRLMLVEVPAYNLKVCVRHERA